MASGDKIKIPQIVAFGYNNFKIDVEKAKWSATCCYCSNFHYPSNSATVKNMITESNFRLCLSGNLEHMRYFIASFEGVSLNCR